MPEQQVKLRPGAGRDNVVRICRTNETPADQEFLFRLKLINNDIDWKLKSSDCTMKMQGKLKTQSFDISCFILRQF